MPTYNAQVARRSTRPDSLVPEPLYQQIFDGLPAASAVFGLVPEMQRIQMSALTERLAVTSVLPTAYFTAGDTGLRQTTAMRWKNKELVAEELNAICVVPKNYMADAHIPIWDRVRPRLTEAIGAVIDEAVIFNMTGSKPTTWGPDIYHRAILAGNFVHEGFGVDLGVAVARGGELLAADGYDVNGFVSKPGLNWRLTQLRSSQGVPIFHGDLQGPIGSTLYGMPFRPLKDGAWNATESTLIGGDWSEGIIGIRQDMNFDVFDQGVISDGSGVVVYNLLQQRLVALMVTIRVAWQVANPANRLSGDTDNGAGSEPTEAASRWPWFVLRPAGYTYS